MSDRGEMRKMGEEEKKDRLKIGASEVELIPALDERPPLSDVVRAVEVSAPKGKLEVAQVEKFLLGIEQAWRLRAKDDSSITIHEDKGHLAVVRTKADGTKELRYLREPGLRATLYCDTRELANLVALGLVRDIAVLGVEPKEGETPPKP